MINYIVYQSTNLINNKIYVGVHKCDDSVDDLYRGSGPAIKSAIIKYGISNFSRKTLKKFKTQDLAYEYESIIVNQTFIDRSDTYNMTLGGKGGWDYVNSLNLPNPMHNQDIVQKSILSGQKTRSLNPEKYKKVAVANWAIASSNKIGKLHSDKTKQLQSIGIKLYYTLNKSKLLGVPKSEEHKQKIQDSWNLERRKAQSINMKNRVKLNPELVKTRTGLTNSEEHNKSISDSKKKYWDKAKTIKGICPHCNKEGILAGLKRWHFNNCRYKNET